MAEEQTPAELFDEYLRHVLGARYKQDAMAATQVAFARQWINHLGEVLSHEGIPWELSNRIIRGMIYGSIPTEAEMHLRMSMHQEMLKTLRRGR